MNSLKILRSTYNLSRITSSYKNHLVSLSSELNAKNLSSEIEKAKKAAAAQSKETIFDKIIKKEIPSDILHEDEICMAFSDIMPQAPIHFLVIPKKRIKMLETCEPNDSEILGHLLLTAKTLAKERSPGGYRIVINNGVHGCQSVYHLHVHVLGGRQLNWPPG